MKFFVVIAIALVASASAKNHEISILKEIMKNLTESTPLYRPVADYDTTVQVSYSVQMTEVLDIDDGVLKFRAYVSIAWKNEMIGWDPAKNGGIKMTRLPVDRLWLPDIVPYKGEMKYNEHTKTIIVNADGSFMYIPFTTFKIPCLKVKDDMGSAYNCTLKAGSWTHKAAEMNVDFSNSTPGFSIDDLAPNDRYTVAKTDGQRVVKKYDCCPDEYVHLLMNALIRKTNHH